MVDDPERVAGYRLIRPLGRGGMGTVYEAEDSQFGRRVALKLIATGFVTSPEAVDRFRQEGRLAGTIAHPRCVFVIGADEEAGRPYIVMELMPGTTLQDLVKEVGPLAPRDAVTKILDVIEGLQEAHRIGVIHRDVKPSNCFIEADGRVKIGDFGLSKSLEVDSHLTRTGAFLGTPLYASPEQIRRDPLDVRTDVYSVSATLYYLLTGKAPFDLGDAAATMARIVSDSPPPIRPERPDVPRSLERIVLKGLERNRDRRWKRLEDLRKALLPFVEDWGSVRGLGQRFAANCLDAALLISAFLVVGGTVSRWATRNPELFEYGAITAVFAYYFLMDGVLGGTAGKWAMGIGVRPDSGGGLPGLRRSLIRTSVYFLPALVFPPVLDAIAKRLAIPTISAQFVGTRLLSLLWLIVLFSTARPLNGYRGLHEIVSETRVVRRLRARTQTRSARETRPVRQAQVVMPKGIPSTLGPFAIEGAMLWDLRRKVLLGHDTGLKRPVWIVLRAKSAGPLPAARLALSRPSRQHWISGGETATDRWDAFEAAEGCLLADLVVAEGMRSGSLIEGRRGLNWSSARPILEQLASELSAACRDGTLPHDLTPEHVWIPVHGHVQLLDTPMGGLDTTARTQPVAVTPTDDPKRALAFLREIAILILEGRHRPVGDPPKPIRAGVPLHVRAMLDRLIGVRQPFAAIEPMLDELESTREGMAEFPLALRLVHFGLFLSETILKVGIAMGVVRLIFFLLVRARPGWNESPSILVAESWTFAAVLLIVWPTWAAITRGGFGLHVLGMAPVRADGIVASRWRLAWRDACLMIPLASVAVATFALEQHNIGVRWLPFARVAALCLLPVAYAIHGLFFPGRLLQDRMAGTLLVPQ